MNDKKAPAAQEPTGIAYGTFTVCFGGIFTRQMQCDTCKATFTEPTERPYNACPYCYARRLGDGKTD